MMSPPESIRDLRNITYAYNYINWTWVDPQDTDFNKVMVYLNGIFQTNVTKGIHFYNATGLSPEIVYAISTHTVGSSGNIINPLLLVAQCRVYVVPSSHHSLK